MEIPGWVFIIVGLVVGGFSLFIGGGLMIFFYFSVVFIAYGGIKWFLLRNVSGSRELNIQPGKYCKQCGGTLPGDAGYCHKCGLRLGEL